MFSEVIKIQFEVPEPHLPKNNHFFILNELIFHKNQTFLYNNTEVILGNKLNFFYYKIFQLVELMKKF